tara:strand:+ start:4208 stop:5362 length:1155 start_codon:yes stop_codon:yes gene_type:complete
MSNSSSHIYKKRQFSNNKGLFIFSLVAIGLTLNLQTLSAPISNTKDESRYSRRTSSFISEAIEKTGSSVVTIDTQRFVKNNNLNNLRNLDPYFERLFGLGLPYEDQPRLEQSQGSGFIFRDGLVITNAHVVNKSEKLIIGLSDGRKFRGKVIGLDSLTDLAVIKLEGKGPWPIAVLGNSDQVKVGDWAIAVGNPYGLENTVTLGIISNLNRDVSQLGISNKKFNLIQTDAAINPGNSGGPLLNYFGEVIGINTLIRSGPGAGLSFAIPINKAKKIADDLIKNGKIIHPMIGISLINSSSLDTNDNEVKVGYVVPNSPAYKSGILTNDIILKIDRKVMVKPSDVVEAISNNGIKKTLNILLKRNNNLLNVKVKPIDIRDLRRMKD